MVHWKAHWGVLRKLQGARGKRGAASPDDVDTDVHRYLHNMGESSDPQSSEHRQDDGGSGGGSCGPVSGASAGAGAGMKRKQPARNHRC